MRRLAVLMWGLPADSAVSRVISAEMPAPEHGEIPAPDAAIPRIKAGQLGQAMAMNKGR